MKKGLRHGPSIRTRHPSEIQTRDLMKKGLRQLYVPLLSTWDIQTRDLMKKGLRRLRLLELLGLLQSKPET